MHCALYQILPFLSSHLLRVRFYIGLTPRARRATASKTLARSHSNLIYLKLACDASTSSYSYELKDRPDVIRSADAWTNEKTPTLHKRPIAGRRHT